MDRRYLAFFAMSFAIILLWKAIFPQHPPVKPQAKAAAAADADEADDAEADEAEADDEQADAAEPDADEQADDNNAQPAVAVPPPANSPHYLSLGSINAASPYRLAATLDSHGATIRRIELASSKYRDLHNRHGFLGHLELVDTPSGAEVQVVTPGSPAAAAGLQAGDIIQSVEPDGESDVQGGPVPSAVDLPVLLDRFKPGNSVQVTINRGGKPSTLTAKLIREPLNLIRPETENIRLHSSELPADLVEHPSLELQLRKIGPNAPARADLDAANNQLATGVWAVDQSVADQLTFSMVLPKLGLEVRKRYAIATVPADEKDAKYPAYHLEFEVDVRNLLSTPQQVSYSLQGPNGLPIEGFWYANKVGRGWGGYGIRDVIVRTYGNPEADFSCRQIAQGKTEAYGDGESLAYMAVDAQYFAVAMLPKKDTQEDRWYARLQPNLATYRVDKEQAAIDKADGVPRDQQGVIVERNGYKLRYANSSFRLTSSTVDLAGAGEAGDSVAHPSTLFTGPKHPDLLAKYTASASPDYSLGELVYYGWFGSLYIPQFMVMVLSAFHKIVHSYGLAIVLLTVLVRGGMSPLSRKQAKNMLKMQELKPEMERIAARYKDDVQARTKAQQELWAKHNYNPMGGCWLMFIQLPIFIGLYRSLMVDVDLREASLIPGIRWCSNLAAPDLAFDWSWLQWPQWFLNGEGMFALGPYLNVLPLATVSLFLVQQKMFTPPAADEQAETMQKMMKYMMFFMGFMFFKVAAGLCLYFIASSLWGIVERKLIPRPAAPATAAVAGSTKDLSAKKKATSARPGKGNGKAAGKRKR